MLLLLRVLFVASFCLATVGAAGFAAPPEALAWPLFGPGLGLALATGWALRRAARAAGAAAAAGDASLAALGSEVARIRDAVRTLAGEAQKLDSPALAARLDAVILPCRMLGNRNEEFLRALGTQAYVRVWDGFATAERLLARAWSMAADGFPDEARLELPKALAHLERSVAAAHA